MANVTPGVPNEDLLPTQRQTEMSPDVYSHPRTYSPDMIQQQDPEYMDPIESQLGAPIQQQAKLPLGGMDLSSLLRLIQFIGTQQPAQDDKKPADDQKAAPAEQPSQTPDKTMLDRLARWLMEHTQQ